MSFKIILNGSYKRTDNTHVCNVYIFIRSKAFNSKFRGLKFNIFS